MLKCPQQATWSVGTIDGVSTACDEHLSLVMRATMERGYDILMCALITKGRRCVWTFPELADQTESGLPRRHLPRATRHGPCWCGMIHTTAEATGLNGWSSGGMLL